MGTVLGLDLGIKTGSLAAITVNEEYNLIESQRILASWTKGPSIKSSLDQSILKFFNQNVCPYIELAPVLAIDWDISEIYWAANKRNTNTLTFIAGYITSLAHKRGIHVVHLSPQKVRSFFGFVGQVDKSEVQRNFITAPRIYNKYWDSYNTNHDLDAIILGYVTDLRTRGESCPDFLKVRNKW